MRRARKLGCDRIDILVTSPGRQAANGRELVSRLAETTRVPTRVLTPDEEGELAWYGAVAALESAPSDLIAVCDVGGGSTQVVVGSDSGGPAWARSFDLGSLRLTRRALGAAPASPEALDAARAEVSAAFAELTPPLARTAIATGGTARALRKVVGTTLDAESLSSAARRLAKRSSRSIEETYGVGSSASADADRRDAHPRRGTESTRRAARDRPRRDPRRGCARSRSTSWPKRSARSGTARRACPRRRARALHPSSAKRRRWCR